MKGETPMDGSVRSNFSNLVLGGNMRRSSKSHPRSESGHSFMSPGRSRSSGPLQGPKMQDIMKLKQWSGVRGEDSRSVSSQISLHSQPQTASLASSEVNSVGRYSIDWGEGNRSYGNIRNDDAMSISSESSRLSYFPLTQGSVSGFSEGNSALGKRKFSCITEAISDSDEDSSQETVHVPKRPRTPVGSSDQIPARKSSFFKKTKEFLLKLLLIILKLGAFLFCLVTILLCYASYKNYQCSQYR